MRESSSIREYAVKALKSFWFWCIVIVPIASYLLLLIYSPKFASIRLDGTITLGISQFTKLEKLKRALESMQELDRIKSGKPVGNDFAIEISGKISISGKSTRPRLSSIGDLLNINNVSYIRVEKFPMRSNKSEGSWDYKLGDVIIYNYDEQTDSLHQLAANGLYILNSRLNFAVEMEDAEFLMPPNFELSATRRSLEITLSCIGEHLELSGAFPVELLSPQHITISPFNRFSIVGKDESGLRSTPKFFEHYLTNYDYIYYVTFLPSTNSKIFTSSDTGVYLTVLPDDHFEISSDTSVSVSIQNLEGHAKIDNLLQNERIDLKGLDDIKIEIKELNEFKVDIGDIENGDVIECKVGIEGKSKDAFINDRNVIRKGSKAIVLSLIENEFSRGVILLTLGIALGIVFERLFRHKKEA